MYTDLPKLTRCCFCFSLRHGLLVWGYLKLIPTTLLLIVLIGDLQRIINRMEMSVPAPLIILLVTASFDLIFDVILIVAAHKKNKKLFQYYFYYSILLMAVFLILLLIFISEQINLIAEHPNYAQYIWYSMMQTIGVCIFIIFIQIYIVLLIRTEMEKLNSNSKFEFVNLANVAQDSLDLAKV